MVYVEIYSDGSALGNPGPGGYGTILMSGEHRKELCGGYAYTTNNRMELMAVIAGLEALKQEACEVTVYSDSSYVVNAVEKMWVFEWEKKRFRNKKNADLWQRFLKNYRKHNVKFIWVKGHAGNPFNERCDQLAAAAAAASGLPEDTFYMMQTQNNNLLD
jgi:ribonuclease HI